MKALSIVAAFLGGVTLGAAAGILFAPEKVKTPVEKLLKFFAKGHSTESCRNGRLSRSNSSRSKRR